MMQAMECLSCTWVVVDEINQDQSMIAANKMSDRGVTMLATGHVCLGDCSEAELVKTIMGSPHSRLVGGQYVTLIGDKMAKEQNTSKNIWSSKTKPPFKWIVHLKGLTPAEWSEPIHIAPALRQYFEHKNRRNGSKEGQWRNNGGNGGGNYGGNGTSKTITKWIK